MGSTLKELGLGTYQNVAMVRVDDHECTSKDEDCDKDGDDNLCHKICNYYCVCTLYSLFFICFFYCFKLQISPETPLIKAFHLFAEKRVSALPVVDDRGTSLYDVWSLLALKINY